MFGWGTTSSKDTKPALYAWCCPLWSARICLPSWVQIRWNEIVRLCIWLLQWWRWNQVAKWGERERERISITLRMCARFTCKVWYSSTILWKFSLHLEEYTSSRKRLWEKFCELWKEYLTLKRYSAVCEKKKMEKRVSLKRNGKTEENRLIQLNSRLMPLLISQKMSLIGLKEERNTWGNHYGIKIKKYTRQSFWN